MRLATQFGQSFGHLRLELLCDVGRKDDLARSGVVAHSAGFESKSMSSERGLKGSVIAVEASRVIKKVSTNKEGTHFVSGPIQIFPTSSESPS